MKAYYQDASATILHGDVRELAPALGQTFDAIIADPTYGETSLAWDRRAKGWQAAVTPLLNPAASIWCFGSMRLFMETGSEFLEHWQLAQDIIWEKQNGTGFAADRFKRVHENACHFYQRGRAWADVYNRTPTTPDATAKQVRRKQRPQHMGSIDAGHYVSEDGGPRLMRSVIYLRNCHGYARHPTQKPEELVRYLVECSCPVGGGILSPFMGSGTDLVVAKLSGRTAVGIDIDEATCESAAKWLSSTLAFVGAA